MSFQMKYFVSEMAGKTFYISASQGVIRDVMGWHKTKSVSSDMIMFCAFATV